MVSLAANPEEPSPPTEVVDQTCDGHESFCGSASVDGVRYLQVPRRRSVIGRPP